MEQTTQSQTVPEQQQPGVYTTTPPERVRAAQEAFVRSYITVYSSGVNVSNLDGKHFRDWQPEDFRRLETSTITLLRAVAISERYDLIDQVRPTNMSRAEFTRTLLRESARRGNTIDYYASRFDFPEGDVTVTRPRGVPESQQRTITEDPALVTARDAAVAILRNRNHGSMVAQDDVVAQTGPYPEGRRPGFPILTDTSAYDLGYTMGAVPQNRPDGSLPMSLIFLNTADADLQRGYCAVTNDIFAREGRSLDQQEAFSAGFTQARVDGRHNFETRDVPIGLFGACAPNTPPVTNNDRWLFALRTDNAAASRN